MIVGIVIAAGASTRMGRPKAFLPIGDDVFVTRVCRVLAAGGLDDVVVVASEADFDGVSAHLARANIRARVLANPRRDQGQLTSVQAGLAVADRPGVEAILVHLVDAPLVAAGTVRAVVDAFRRTHAPVVRPVVGTRHGHPTLFARLVFQDLRVADLAIGAKAVVRAHAADVCDVAVDDPGACQDIDTPEDYARLVGELPAQGPSSA